MQHPSPQKAAQQGFTLIELSIVLVIIGLIVGGVLVGQDLIKAAQIRATVAQLDAYDSAVNTFRGKYNGLPGDVNNCVSFFQTADCPTGGAAAMVEGNGTFEDFAGTHLQLTGEVSAFWRHLYDASLIGDAITDTASISATANATSLTNAYPSAKLGSGNFIVAYTGDSTITYAGMAGTNIYRITGLTEAGGVPTLSPKLTPLEAYQIDTKKDDGVPNSGVVQGTDSTVLNSATDVSSGTGNTKCLNLSGTATIYNTALGTGSVANTRLCNILVRTSF